MKRKTKLLIFCSVVLALALILCGCFFGDRLLNGDRLKIREDLPIGITFRPEGISFGESRVLGDKELTEEFVSFLREFRYDDYFILGKTSGELDTDFALYYGGVSYLYVDLRSEEGLVAGPDENQFAVIYYPKDTAAYQEKRKYFLEKFSEAAGFPVKTEWENFSESAGLP